MKELRMHNGDVRDAPKVCRTCQTPNADAQYSDGEWYHRECVPVGVV